MDLGTAIQKVTDDYDVPEGETADPVTAVRSARELMASAPTPERCHAEIDYWELDDAELAEAYHMVVDASDDDIAGVLGDYR
jgi:hypothetical protein